MSVNLTGRGDELNGKFVFCREIYIKFVLFIKYTRYTSSPRLCVYKQKSYG